MRTQLLSLWLFLCIFLSITGAGVVVVASDLLILEDHVKVYAEPNTSSQVVAMVRKGAVVQVMVDQVPGYQKILVKTNKGNKIGFIRSTDLISPNKHEASHEKSQSKNRLDQNLIQ